MVTKIGYGSNTLNKTCFTHYSYTIYILILHWRRKTQVSEHITVSWLRKLLIVDHFILNADKYFLHSICCIPLLEHMKLAWFNSTIWLVDTWQINLWIKLESWWLGWIVVSTPNWKHVNSIVEVCVWWTNNSTIPVSERFVITYYNIE